MKKKVLIVLAVIVLLVFARYALTQFMTTTIGKHRAKAMIPAVTLSTVGEVEVTNTLEAPGRITPKDTVNIVAKVDGTLQSVNFQEGEYVRKGQVLYNIDPLKYNLAVNRAYADLQTARAQSVKARKDYLRAQELVKKDYIARSTFDDTFAQMEVANATVNAASALLADSRRLQNYTRVTSPISGRAGATNVTQGNQVAPSMGALTKVISTDPMYVTYSLDSKQFNQLRGDTILPTVKQKEAIRVELTLSDGAVYKYQGKEDFWGNEISQSTGSIPLRATFKNPENTLIPGDFVKVKIFSNTKVKKLAVPQSAVLQDSGGRYVYRVDKEGNAEQVYIETEREYGKNWIVASGLSLGDSFILDGVVKVMPKRPVRVITQEEAEKAKQEAEKTTKESK